MNGFEVSAFSQLLEEMGKRPPSLEETIWLFRAVDGSAQALAALCEVAARVRDREMNGRDEVEAAFNSVVPCLLRPLCCYCPYWRDENQELMSVEEIVQQVRYLREETEVRQFHLSGGSLRGPEDCGVVGIVEAIRDAGFVDMDVVVNCGASFSDADLARLKELRVKRVFSVFETTNPQVFSATKPGDDLDEKRRFAARIAQAGMEVGSGIMAGLGPVDTRFEDYAKALSDLAALENLSCVYVSKFRHAARILMNDHPECPLDEALALIAMARLVLREVHIRAAAGWCAKDQVRATGAGAGSITIPCSFSKGRTHWAASGR
ncbi:MAG: radical SAM protein [Gordonibacter sp.]|uniref:radical SAM protein n=1 Tax=Gordonibacter sp. TaxID=1968902 RepID=UPI002FC5AFC9